MRKAKKVCAKTYHLTDELLCSPGCTLRTKIDNQAIIPGYCILPIVGLSGLGVLVTLNGLVGTITALLAVTWCSLSGMLTYSVSSLP